MFVFKTIVKSQLLRREAYT